MSVYNSCTKVFVDSASKNSVVNKLYIILTFNSAIFTANFLMLANMFLGVGTPYNCSGVLP